MSRADQIQSSALHREALLTVRRPVLRPSLITSLSRRKAVMTSGPNVLASLPVPGSPVLPGRGEDLIAAGLLMLAGHVDLDELDHCIQVGWERCQVRLSVKLQT